MWKKLILLFTIVFTVTACSPGTSTPTPTPTPSKITLIWWNMFEPQANVQPLIDAYEVLHPNVVIQYAQKGISTGVDGYKNELDVVLRDTDPLNNPDIFTIGNTWAGKYDQFITHAPTGTFTQQDTDDYYPVIKTDFFANGVEAVPINADAIAVIYNKDKLIESGYTTPEENDWSGFLTQAQTMTKHDSANRIISAGFSAGFPANTEFMFDLVNLLMIQNGVKMTDTGATKSTFADDSEITKAQNALAFYAKFTTANPTWAADQKKDIAAFLEKKLAMFIAPSWRLIDVLNYNKQYNLGLNVGVVPVPQLGNKSIYWADYWGQTVSKQSRNPAVAWDFLKFITTADQQLLLDTTVKKNGRPFGLIFPRMSQAKLITGNDQINPLLGPFIQSLTSAQDWNMADGYAVKKVFDESFTKGTDLKTTAGQVNTIIKNKALP
jgi:ABC-type glycerol-3-phosphate transport system substrate-binding protein